MHIRKTSDGLQLYRWPVDEIKTLYGSSWTLPSDISPTEANEKLRDVSLEAMDVSLEFQPDAAENMVMTIRGSSLTYDAGKRHLHFISKTNQDRRPAWDKLTAEQKKDRKNWRHRYDQFVMEDALNEDGTVKLRILVDRGSLEFFLNDGITVLTHSEIHPLDDRSISFRGGGQTVIKTMQIHEVTSSWK